MLAAMLLLWVTGTCSAQQFPALKVLKGPDPSRTVELKEFMETDLSKCSCNQAPGGCRKADNTLVSAIVSIHKPGRSFDNYVLHFKELLQRYPETAFVGYVQKGYGEQVKNAHPNGPDADTLCLIEVELEDLPLQALLKDWAKAMVKMWFKMHKFLVPETVHPEYDVITNSKVMLTARAAKYNPFNSTRFGWIDGGLHPPMDKHLPTDGNIDLLTCESKVCIGFNYNTTCVKKDWEKWKEDSGKAKIDLSFNCNNCENGSVFSGTRSAILALVEPHYELIVKYLSEHAVDDDQGVMQTLFLQRPDLLKDTGCKGWEYCAPFMLGKFKSENDSLYRYQSCDENGFQSGKAWAPEDDKKSERRLLI